jgi:cellulose synthase/poly-beta-1,6-N-acetylglucosamine synthase-like glycosyltransferase
VPGTDRAIASPWRPSGRGVVPRPDLVFFVALCLGWVALSQWLSFPGLLALIGLVYVGLNARLLSFALFDVPPRRRRVADFPELTLIVATHDDEDVIEETLARASAQQYPGELRILVADTGSADETVERASRFAEHHLGISVCRFPHDAKSRTLNLALNTVSSPLVATIDAGTLLRPGALRLCAGRLLVSSVSTVAVGGSVFVSTARENLLAQAEEWDPDLAVIPARRPQDDLRGPPMTQHDFTVLRTGAAREFSAPSGV